MVEPKIIIQEGLYIRTDGGVIAKIMKKNSTGSITCDRIVSSHAGGWSYGNKTLTDLSKIKKISSNEIDLIMFGDIITFKDDEDIYKVIGLPIDGDNSFYLAKNYDGETEDIRVTYENMSESIRSIVTKEQFERMEYLV